MSDDFWPDERVELTEIGWELAAIADEFLAGMAASLEKEEIELEITVDDVFQQDAVDALADEPLLSLTPDS